MPIINIRVNGKIAIGDNTKIVCENSDYIVRFEFDTKWQEHEIKTMRVEYDGQYVETVFTGNEADLPTIYNSTSVAIGVYAGDLETSTPAFFVCDLSILSGSKKHAEPPEDVYNRLVLISEETRDIAQSVRDDADNGVFKGDKGDNGADAVTDLMFNPKSENAQSGKAVAEALELQKEWVLYDEITITQAEIEAAGGEGITSVMIGDGVTPIPDWATQIKQESRIPSLGYSMSNVRFMSSLTNNINDYKNSLYSNYTPTYGTNIHTDKNVWFKFIGDLKSNFVIGSYGYSFVPYGTLSRSLTASIDKAKTTNCVMGTNNPDYKFPAGTKFSIHYR